MDPSQNATGLSSDLPAPAQATPQGPQAVPSAAAPAPVVPPAPVQAQASNSPYSPKIAEDVDLIEKEWVVKAKAIVASTKDDPSQQNRDMNKFKADYLKTRYSKDIKINES